MILCRDEKINSQTHIFKPNLPPPTLISIPTIKKREPDVVAVVPDAANHNSGEKNRLII